VVYIADGTFRRRFLRTSSRDNMRLFSGLCALAALGHTAGAQRAPTDSIRLSRAQAIADALANNAQLDSANRQPKRARAA
jgi:hypothetical protein